MARVKNTRAKTLFCTRSEFYLLNPVVFQNHDFPSWHTACQVRHYKNVGTENLLPLRSHVWDIMDEINDILLTDFKDVVYLRTTEKR